MTLANNQSVEADLRRLQREKVDLDSQIDSLNKDNKSYYAQ